MDTFVVDQAHVENDPSDHWGIITFSGEDKIKLEDHKKITAFLKTYFYGEHAVNETKTYKI